MNSSEFILTSSRLCSLIAKMNLEKERNYEFFSKRKWLSYPKFSVLSLHSLGCCVILSTKLEKERELS